MLFNLRGQSYARMDAKFDKKQFQKISSEKFIHCTSLRRMERRRGWEKQTFIHSKPKEVSKVIFWCRNQKIGEQRHRELRRPFGWELTEGWRMLGADNVPPIQFTTAVLTCRCSFERTKTSLLGIGLWGRILKSLKNVRCPSHLKSASRQTFNR